MHLNSNPHTYIQIPHQHFHKSADKSIFSNISEILKKVLKNLFFRAYLMGNGNQGRFSLATDTVIQGGCNHGNQIYFCNLSLGYHKFFLLLKYLINQYK
jgi:hypothetical protein